MSYTRLFSVERWSLYLDSILPFVSVDIRGYIVVWELDSNFKGDQIGKIRRSSYVMLTSKSFITVLHSLKHQLSFEIAGYAFARSISDPMFALVVRHRHISRPCYCPY